MPLGQRDDCGDARYSGAVACFSQEPSQHLQAMLTCGFDFIAAPLVDPARQPSCDPLARQEVMLLASQWSGQVVGIASQAALAAIETVQGQAALRAELQWASHLGLNACLLPLPPQQGTASFARVINQVMAGLSGMALWLEVPLRPVQQPVKLEQSLAAAGAEHQAEQRQQQDAWEQWHRIRCLCDHNSQLGVLLLVQASLPAQAEIERWLGEPVKAALLPTSVFAANKKGYPALPKAHQAFVTLMLQHTVQLILEGSPEQQAGQEQREGLPSQDPTPAEAAAAPPRPGNVVELAADGSLVPAALQRPHPLRLHWEYLSYLFRRQPALSEDERLSLSYRDYLQAPLQPLQDNLENSTYETFERDSIKYTLYREAICRALQDRAARLGEAAAPAVVMVVGAGRGPLVRATLQAASSAQCDVRVWAVEKNPNAAISLQDIIWSQGWQGSVTLVAADMRSWEPEERADVLVSELLGSFGDNELSPECLDGAQRLLAPRGVSIPCSYTSFLQPVTSSKLWADVKAYDDREHLETPFVSSLHRFTPLANSQPAFTFSHPTQQPADNSRACHLTFQPSLAAGAVCHGLAGYFEAELYGGVSLSIHPPSHTPGMYSWFPLFFPLREPQYWDPAQPLSVHMWRCAAHHKVWYEWALQQGSRATPIHNTGGCSYHVGL